MKKDYKKLGGWLLGFLIFRAIGILVGFNLLNEAFGAHSMIERASVYYGFGYKMTYYFLILDAVIVIAGNIAIIVLMFKKNKVALGWIKKILVSITMIDFAISVGAMLYLSSLTSDSVFSLSDILSVIGVLVGLALWYQYLIKSRRVAVYFDENYVEEVETVEVFID